MPLEDVKLHAYRTAQLMDAPSQERDQSMATEFEKLRLQVGLVDNASAGLQNLTGDLQQLTRPRSDASSSSGRLGDRYRKD